MNTPTMTTVSTATTRTTRTMGMTISNTFKVEAGCDGASVVSVGTWHACMKKGGRWEGDECVREEIKGNSAWRQCSRAPIAWQKEVVSACNT